MIPMENRMEKTLREALRKAAEIQNSAFGAPVDYSQKESRASILTSTDLESEDVIISTIFKEFPDHNLLSEECGLIWNNSDYTWVIDPLDGTSNFAAGIPWFGVLISIFRNNIPVMAGAILPVENKLYFASEGKGAWLDDKRIFVQDEKAVKTLMAFSSDFFDDPDIKKDTAEWYSRSAALSRNIRSTNSLIDMLLVAEGKLGGCINLFTKIWDISACWLILREAGGEMQSLDFKPLVFSLDKNDIKLNYRIIAGGKQFLQDFKSSCL